MEESWEEDGRRSQEGSFQVRCARQAEEFAKQCMAVLGGGEAAIMP